MNLRVIRAIMLKDIKDIVRNRSALFGLLTPIFLAILYLLITVAQKSEPTDIIAYNPDNVAITQTLGLRPIDTVNIINAASPDEVRNAMRTEKPSQSYGIIIPANTVADAKAGKQPKVELYINAEKEQDAISRQRTTIVFASYFTTAAAQPLPIQLVTETVNKPKDADNSPLAKFFSNPNALGSFYGGFIIALTPLIIGMQILPMLIVEEKEKKTLRFVLSSPARPREFILAKALLGFIYSLILALLVLTMNSAVVENIPLVLLFAAIGSLFGVSLGLIMGAFFSNVQSVNSWASMLMMVMMLPGIFVIFGVTGIFAILLRIIPSYWLMDGTIGTAMGSLDPATAALDLGLSIAAVAVLLLLSMYILRRRSLEAA